MKLPLEGGCLCGRVRYRVGEAPVSAAICHCRMCQKNSGAPAQPSAEVPVSGFAFIKGEPKIYRSSSWGERVFCGDCGSPLLYRLSKDPKTVSINTPTLDDPAAIPPTHHIYIESRVSWFDTKDDLPRFEGAGPEA
jgi:hypothetical protein